MEGIQRALGITPGTPYRPPVFVLLGVAAVSGIVTFVVLVTGADEGIWIASIAMLGAAVILLAMAIPLSRAHQRAMDELLANEPWARWTFSQDEWNRFAAQAWSNNRRDAWLVIRVFLGLGVAIGLIGTVFGGDLSASGVTVGVQMMLGLGLIGLLAGGIVLITGSWRYARASVVVREIVIGPSGFFFRGRYRPLVGPGLRLKAVVIEPGDPAILCFTTCSSMGSEQRTSETQRVPIPRGCETEARAVVDRFRGI